MIAELLTVLGNTEIDVERRIGIASGVMKSLNAIWKAKEISRNTKVRVHEVLVLSALLFNSETWTLKEDTKRKLSVFEMGCSEKIRGITR